MIAVETRGRLGNQMFQFAFGLAAARRLGTDFVIDERLLRRYFELTPHDGWPGRVRRSVTFRLARRKSAYRVVGVDADARPEDVVAALDDRRTYVGFFQSERYFAEARTQICQAFRARPEHEREFATRYGDLVERPYVCCHVRATDYHEWQGGVVLPPSYYREAIDRDGGAPIVFVGDDLREMSEAFAGRGNDVRFERNSEIVDLLLLTRATTVITSNSSFGWWGAWLGDPTRRVFAPRRWLGFRGDSDWPPGILPPTWTQLEVAADG